MNRGDAESAAGLPALVALAAHHARPASPARETDLDLRALTKAIRRGDEAAFTCFYERYSFRLYKYLLALAKGNENEAREVLQNVVMKLATRFKVFDQEAQLWSWICRSARNAYVDLCRAHRREQRFIPLEHCQGNLPDLQAEEHQLSASLHHALAQLTDEERELVRAAYVDEQSLQALATESGQTYKAMESRLARLRRKLKTSLLNHLRHEKSD